MSAVAFYIERDGRLFGLAGWWVKPDLAMRFNTREEAEQGRRDLALPADARIVERPHEAPAVLMAGVARDYDPFGLARG